MASDTAHIHTSDHSSDFGAAHLNWSSPSDDGTCSALALLMLSSPDNIVITRVEAPPPRADQASSSAASSARVAQLIELISSLSHSADPHEGLEGLASGVLRSGRAAYAEIITS